MFSQTLLFLLSSCLVIDSTMSSDTVESAVPSKLIDQLVSALSSVQMLDPLAIPQYTIILKKKSGSTVTNGHAVIANTSLTGLSKVHPQPVSSPNFDAPSDDPTTVTSFPVRLHLGQGNVKVVSDSAVKIGDSAYPKLSIVADIVDIGLTFTVTPGGQPSPLSDLIINDFKFNRFTVQGLKEGDPLVSGLRKAYLTILNRKGRVLLTNSIKPILEAELNNYHTVL